MEAARNIERKYPTRTLPGVTTQNISASASQIWYKDTYFII